MAARGSPRRRAPEHAGPCDRHLSCGRAARRQAGGRSVRGRGPQASRAGMAQVPVRARTQSRPANAAICWPAARSKARSTRVPWCACASRWAPGASRRPRPPAAATWRGIGRQLGAGTNCGSCIPEIRRLIAERRRWSVTSPEPAPARSPQPQAPAPHGRGWRRCPSSLRSVAGAPSLLAATRLLPGRPSCCRRQARPSRCRAPIPVPRWKRLPPILPAGRCGSTAGRGRRRTLPARRSGRGAADDDDEASAHLRGGARCRRTGQRDRPARLLHLPVRRHRQPLAAGGGHLHRWRGARLRPGDPLAHRGAAARRASRAGPPPPSDGAPTSGGSSWAPRVRRRFWERFAALALADAGPAPQRARSQGAAATQARDEHGAAAHMGQVTLVGAGPGNPELLTLRAVRALRSADVILFDDLVAPEILDFARREAKRMLVGKTGYRPVLQAGRHQRADGRRSPDPASAWCASRPATP